VLWLVGVTAVMAIRGFRQASSERARELGARVALGCVAVYIAAMVLADFAERSRVREELAARGITGVEAVMVAPTPANPFAGEVVAATASSYYVGTWHWLPTPKLELADEPIQKRTLDPVYVAAAQTPEARRYLTWARFPFVVVETRADGHTVRFRDARYAATERLPGPTVRLDRDLRPLPAATR
jgi:hypothetical protein